MRVSECVACIFPGGLGRRRLCIYMGNGNLAYCLLSCDSFRGVGTSHVCIRVAISTLRKVPRVWLAGWLVDA